MSVVDEFTTSVEWIEFMYMDSFQNKRLDCKQLNTIKQ